LKDHLVAWHSTLPDHHNLILHLEAEFSALVSSEGARLEKEEDGRIRLQLPKEAAIYGRDLSHDCHVRNCDITYTTTLW